MSKSIKELKKFTSYFSPSDELIFDNQNETDVLIREEAKFLASQMNLSDLSVADKNDEDEHDKKMIEEFIKDKVSLEMSSHEKLYSMLEKNNEILIGILTKLSIDNDTKSELEKNDIKFNPSFIEEKSSSNKLDNYEETLITIKDFLGKENSFYEFTKKNNFTLMNDFNIKLQEAISDSCKINNKKNFDLILNLDQQIKDSIDFSKEKDGKKYSKISGQIFNLKKEIMETINSSLLFNTDLIKDLSSFFDAKFSLIKEEFINMGKEISNAHKISVDNTLLIDEFDNKLNSLMKDSNEFNINKIESINEISKKVDKFNLEIDELRNESSQVKSYFYENRDFLNTIHSDLESLKNVNNLFEDTTNNFKNDLLNLKDSFEKEKSNLNSIFSDNLNEFKNEMENIKDAFQEDKLNFSSSIVNNIIEFKNEISDIKELLEEDKSNLNQLIIEDINEFRNEISSLKESYLDQKTFSLNNSSNEDINEFKNNISHLQDSLNKEKHNLNNLLEENLINIKNEISNIKENFDEEKSNLANSMDQSIIDFKNEISDIKESIQEEKSNLNSIFENSFNNLKNDLSIFRESFEKDKSYINEANKEILTYLENKEMVKDVLSDKEFSEKIEDTVQNKLIKNNSILNKNFNSLIEETKYKIQDLEDEMSKLNYRKELDQILHIQTDNWNSIDISRNEIQDKINELELEIKNLNYRKELDGILEAQFYYSESMSASNKEIQDKIFYIENDFLEKIQNVESKINSNLNIINELKDSYNSNEIDNLITDKLVTIVQEKIINIDSKMLFLKKEIENNLTYLIENQFEKNISKNEEYNKKIKNQTLNMIYSELNKFNNKFDNLNGEIIKNYDLLMINNRVLDTLEDLLTDQFSKKNDLDIERKNLIEELIKKAKDNKNLITILQNKIDYSIDNTDLYNSIIRKTISRDSDFLKEVDDQTYKYVKNLTLELVSKELSKHTNFIKQNNNEIEFEEVKLSSNNIEENNDFNSDDFNNKLISKIKINDEKSNTEIIDKILNIEENTNNKIIDETEINDEIILNKAKNIENIFIDEEIYNTEIIDKILNIEEKSNTEIIDKILNIEENTNNKIIDETEINDEIILNKAKNIENIFIDEEIYNTEIIDKILNIEENTNNKIIDKILNIEENTNNKIIDETEINDEIILNKAKNIENIFLDEEIYNTEILDNILHSHNNNNNNDDDDDDDDDFINDILYESENIESSFVDSSSIDKDGNLIEDATNNLNDINQILNLEGYIKNDILEDIEIAEENITDDTIKNDILEDIEIAEENITDDTIKNDILEDIEILKENIDEEMTIDSVKNIPSVKKNDDLSFSEFDKNNIFQKENNPYFKYKIKELLVQLLNNENAVISNEIGFYKTNLLNQNSDYLNQDHYVKELENYFSSIEDLEKNNFNEGELNE